MPDFSEILKIAVEQQDWQLICGLYTNITGEPLSVPSAILQKEEEVEQEDVLSKEYSIEELKYQNQLSPQEQDTELLDKDIDNMISSRYNDFTAPPRNEDGKNDNITGRRMRSEPVGSTKLQNVFGVSENSFVDNMTESLINPETGEKLTGQNKDVQITPRNRRKELGMKNTPSINVGCSLCKKEYKISSTLSHGYSENESQNTWKCNDCSTRKSRRNRDKVG
tara:strand:- start:465 stop:1133 length:669 start_codon:yes stop_codon:yes gene_type:complete